MRRKRDTAKYHLKVVKGKHRGAAKDLKLREEGHEEKWPKGQIRQVGRRTTEDAARNLEERGERGLMGSLT